MGFLSGLSTAFQMSGALLGQDGQKEANRQNQAFAQQQWKKNYEAQKEFAQNGLRWKVDDAKAAGIHPLFGLGASGSSFSPVNTQSYFENEQSGLGNSLSNMGQSIGRSIQAKQTRQERVVQELREEKMFDLETKRIESDIALNQAKASSLLSEKQQSVPPMPLLTDGSKLIDGQGDAVRSPGTEQGLDMIGKFVQYPSGNLMFFPNKDYLDFFSENTAYMAALQYSALSALKNGTLVPPHKAPAGYHWDISDNGLTLQLYPDKPKLPDTSQKNFVTRDVLDWIDFFGQVGEKLYDSF